MAIKRILFTAVIMTVLAFNISGQEHLKKLMNAEFAISQFYVDSISEDKLVEDAIKGMLQQLDPHSSYSTPEETKELEEPLEGEFSGIGIQFNMNADTLYVIQTVAGGPAEKVGIYAGDRIIEVEDTVIAGVKMSNTRIMKMLRGKKGTKVNVLVKRRGVSQPIPFRITRDDIPVYSIDASYMADEKTGYIKISRFGKKTNDEFCDAVDKLKKKGMKQLIIDLTNNGGGYLQTAVELANNFLDSGQEIVYTLGNNSPKYEAKANGRGRFKNDDFKVVVMVNQYSASASEILSGALQDWDRAVIVGRRTFGKGLVQRPFRFNDGSMMRLTVARYYTPSGRCIQKPYKAGDSEKYDMDIYNRLVDGELAHADSIHFSDSLKYETLRAHRVIYGGGGIMPDLFVQEYPHRLVRIVYVFGNYYNLVAALNSPSVVGNAFRPELFARLFKRSHDRNVRFYLCLAVELRQNLLDRTFYFVDFRLLRSFLFRNRIRMSFVFPSKFENIFFFRLT